MKHAVAPQVRHDRPVPIAGKLLGNVGVHPGRYSGNHVAVQKHERQAGPELAIGRQDAVVSLEHVRSQRPRLRGIHAAGPSAPTNISTPPHRCKTRSLDRRESDALALERSRRRQITYVEDSLGCDQCKPGRSLRTLGSQADVGAVWSHIRHVRSVADAAAGAALPSVDGSG